MYCVLSHMDQRSPKFYQLYTYFMHNQGAIMHENCWLVRTGFYFIHLLQYNMRYFLRRYSSKITIHQSIRICYVIMLCVECTSSWWDERVQSTIHTGEYVPPYVLKDRGSSHRGVGQRVVPSASPPVVEDSWRPWEVYPYQAVASCMRLNPTWEYRMWTDKDIDQFIAWEYPFFYDAFQSYPYQIQRVDAARYFILLHHGGDTIDIDHVRRRSTRSWRIKPDMIWSYRKPE